MTFSPVSPGRGQMPIDCLMPKACRNETAFMAISQMHSNGKLLGNPYVGKRSMSLTPQAPGASVLQMVRQMSPYLRESILTIPRGGATSLASSQAINAPSAIHPPDRAAMSAGPPSACRNGGSRNTRVAGSPGVGTRRVASPRTRRVSSSTAALAIFSRRIFEAVRPFSTNVANVAPRESASRPSAPVPANKSSTRAPVTGSPNRPPRRRLKRLSRTRSVVGRSCDPALLLPTAASFKPRKRPPMILMPSIAPSSPIPDPELEPVRRSWPFRAAACLPCNREAH